MDLLNETVLLKTKSTLFNLLIRETSQFLCYERLLNMAYVACKKCIFPRNAILVGLLYSGFISSTIYTIIIQNSSRIPFGCKKCVFLHDTRLWFPDYDDSVREKVTRVYMTLWRRNDVRKFDADAILF